MATQHKKIQSSDVLDRMIREFRKTYPNRSYDEVRNMFLTIAQLDHSLQDQ